MSSSAPGHVALLKVLADGEVVAERRRVEICNLPDFAPREAFEALRPRRGFLRAREIYDFLYTRDSTDVARKSGITMEDVEAALRLNATKLCEVQYKGFMQLVLPRADPRLHDMVMARGEIGTRSVDEIAKSNGALDFMVTNHGLQELYAWPLTREISSSISEKVVTSLGRLLVHEVLLAREVRALRDAMGTTATDVFRGLLGEESDDPEADLEKSLTIRDLCRALDKDESLTSVQVDALFRRLDASGSGLVTVSEVGRILEDLSVKSIRPRIPKTDEDWMDRRPPPRAPASPCPFGIPLDPQLAEHLASYSKPEKGKDLWAPWSDESVAADRQWAAASAQTKKVMTHVVRPKELGTKCSPGVLVVLNTMATQARLYAQVEYMKQNLPPQAMLETCFATIDRSKCGFIDDTDMWQILHENGFGLSVGSLCSLVREVKHVRPPDPQARQSSLSLREFGEVILPRTSKEYAALRITKNDEEAWSLLYILRHTQPCPECGARIQRDSDAGACLSVKCPFCNAVFRCFKIVEEDFKVPQAEMAISGLDVDDGSGNNQKAFLALLRLLEASALAAEKHEDLRRNLIVGAWESVEELLEAAFNAVRGGHSGKGGGFAWESLKDVMEEHGIHTTDQELNCLWHRYAGGTKVSTVETPYGRFCDMLRPFDLSESRLATATTLKSQRTQQFKKQDKRYTVYSMPAGI